MEIILIILIIWFFSNGGFIKIKFGDPNDKDD
jgi:hypothetical protein